MIDHFTQEQFESALPVDKNSGFPLWHHSGLIDGEHSYTLGACNTHVIYIRSTVPETPG